MTHFFAVTRNVNQLKPDRHLPTPMPPLIKLQTHLTAGTLLLFLAGCADEPALRHYVVARENDHNLTSDLLRKEFTPIPFRWNLPKTWTLAPNDQFSLRAWKTGPPTNPARITLGQFPARTGILAQITRWRRQLGLGSTDDDTAMKDVQALRTQNGAGSYAAIRGESESILAFILPIGSQFWIFRFKSANITAKAESEDFRSFCTSLKYVKPPQTGFGADRGLNPSLPPPASHSTSEPKSTPESGAGASDSRPTPASPQISESDNLKSATDPIESSATVESGTNDPPPAGESSAEAD